MAGSLFDQLKQAGLVDDSKARQVKREKHLQRKQGKAQSAGNSAGEAAARAAEEKAERDRRLNRERQAEQAARAEQAAVRQMIESSRLGDWEGELAHHFTDGSKVKTLYVNADTRARLAAGSVRIARLDEGYAPVPSAAAEKIGRRDPDAVLPLPQEHAPPSDEDQEYYAKFQVPDDLDW